MSDDIKRMDITEFRDLGYLQEVNRLFFHPLGLALEVVIERCAECEGRGTDDEGPCPECDGAGKTERLGGVWDSREDPEGFFFADSVDPDKISHVKAEFEKRSGRREALLAARRTVQEPSDDLSGSL